MPLPAPSAFTKYELTEEEMKLATSLNICTLALLQNLAAAAAEKRLALAPDGAKLHEFLQQEAELKGEIGAYQYLLALAETDAVSPNQVAP